MVKQQYQIIRAEPGEGRGGKQELGACKRF